MVSTVRKVLVLEDEGIMQILYKAAIKQIAPHVEVLQAFSVGHAISLIKEHKIDYAILDFNLPDGHSTRFLDHCCRHNLSHRCMMISARERHEVVEATHKYSHGIDHIFQKPITIDQFQETLRSTF